MGIIDDIYRDMNKSDEPKCDIIQCYECGRSYKLVNCPTEQDGDWEFGYYTVHLCPKNPDHEVDYDMSVSQIKKYKKWKEDNEQTN